MSPELRTIELKKENTKIDFVLSNIFSIGLIILKLINSLEILEFNINDKKYLELIGI